MTDVTGAGTLRLDLQASATSIVDSHGVAIEGGYTNGEMYDVDRVSPSVVSVTPPSPKTFAANQVLEFGVGYSEAVLVAGGVPSITVMIGATSVQAALVRGSGSSTLTFATTVTEGALDTDGVSFGAAVTLNGATMRDAVGNTASPTLLGANVALVGVLVDARVAAPPAPTPPTGCVATLTRGCGGSDTYRGTVGNDTFLGGLGNDVLFGGAGSDKLAGGPGNDRVDGGSGNDVVNGTGGNDKLYGGAGNDRINGGTGRDTIFGGSGNDVIFAWDDERDIINCGPGKDTVYTDRVDVVSKNCERVRRIKKAALK